MTPSTEILFLHFVSFLMLLIWWRFSWLFGSLFVTSDIPFRTAKKKVRQRTAKSKTTEEHLKASSSYEKVQRHTTRDLQLWQESAVAMITEMTIFGGHWAAGCWNARAIMQQRDVNWWFWLLKTNVRIHQRLGYGGEATAALLFTLGRK